MEAWYQWLLGKEFLPHGQCYLWKTDVLLTHVISDGIISISYFSIPIALGVLLRYRLDLANFRYMVWLFMLFILFCGMTHLMAIYTIWFPAYQLSGFVKAMTAIVSIATAIVAWPLIPHLLKIPSMGEVVGVNKELNQEVEERKRAEKKLKKYQEQLEDLVNERTSQLREANQLLQKSNEDLEEFAYIISHDLQEPLRMISRFAALSREELGTEVSESAATYLSEVEKGALKMQDMIEGLLSLSRLERGHDEKSHFDLGMIITSVEGTFADERGQFPYQLTREGIGELYANPLSMRMVLQNLIGNAIKYRAADRPLQIHISMTDLGNQWGVSVRDNGIGIEARHKEVVFQAFRKLHPASQYPGTGIGLAIVKKIVERHKGSVSIESEAGQGTRILMTFPKPDSAPALSD